MQCIVRPEILKFVPKHYVNNILLSTIYAVLFMNLIIKFSKKNIFETMEYVTNSLATASLQTADNDNFYKMVFSFEMYIHRIKFGI